MILPKLTKVVGDIESLLGCFSSNTLWRWYSKLDFFLQDQVCEFRKWRSWLTEFKRFIDWYSWMERNRLWPTPAAWSSVKNCWLDKYRKRTRERTPAVRRVENILTEREISRTRRERWWVDTSVMVLSQQRVTPGSTTFFFSSSSKVMMTVAPCFRFLSLIRRTLADRRRSGFGRMNPILTLSSDKLFCFVGCSKFGWGIVVYIVFNKRMATIFILMF